MKKVNTLTISIDDYYDNVQLSIDSLVEDIKLKDFKVEEKKKILALAYVISTLEEKIQDSQKINAQLILEKDNLKKEFKNILQSINSNYIEKEKK